MTYNLSIKERSMILVFGDSYQRLTRRDCTLAEWLQLKFGCTLVRATKYAEWYEQHKVESK